MPITPGVWSLLWAGAGPALTLTSRMTSPDGRLGTPVQHPGTEFLRWDGVLCAPAHFFGFWDGSPRGEGHLLSPLATSPSRGQLLPSFAALAPPDFFSLCLIYHTPGEAPRPSWHFLPASLFLSWFSSCKFISNSLPFDILISISVLFHHLLWKRQHL